MTLVDSNILIDIWTEDPEWHDWSVRSLQDCLEAGPVGINPIIYAELSLGFDHENDLRLAVQDATLDRLPLPYEAAFPAGRAFRAYRQRGGVRTAPLPDFLVGAHAEVEGLVLLTRDAVRFQTYFPKVRLVTPDQTGSNPKSAT